MWKCPAGSGRSAVDHSVAGAIWELCDLREVAEPQFLRLQKGKEDSIYLTGLLQGISKAGTIKRNWYMVFTK